MLARAYELSSKGDFLGAGRECGDQFQQTKNMIAAIEGIDFLVLAQKPDEAMKLVAEADQEARFTRCRLDFFTALALWDLGAKDLAMTTVQRAFELGYNNDERFELEWSKRLDLSNLDDLRALAMAARTRGLVTQNMTAMCR